MKTKIAFCALAVVALAVSACDDRRGGARVDRALCADFKTAKAAPLPTGGDGAASVDDCTRRWAYTLAPSHDDADIVAEAVASACSAQLSRWNQQSLAQPAADGEPTSILTGEPTSPIAEHNTFMRTRAMFYVVQARAGRCPGPKIVNGAPEGVS
ncbi:MAG: hypothetical protein BGN86_13710 [Caulobacterales bacterium 68-7]|nr:MAG: hypothetical protein BGN86_13710 [Caulobacterales bacterium 68-7]